MVYHILNGCSITLSQGRYTWRHNSVLLQLVNLIKPSYSTTTANLYADLPGFRASDNPPSTIPLSITQTTARPDIVIVDNENPYPRIDSSH